MGIIINIRGSSGAGKTTVVRRFVERLPHEAIGGTPGKPKGYRVDATTWGIATPVWIVGSYENTCGGADGIRTQEEIADRVVKAQPFGHVLVEGLLLSQIGLGGTATPILKDHGAVFGFMDTPWDTCVARVLFRRAVAGNDKELDPEKNMRRNFNSVQTVAKKLRDAGCDVRTIPHDDDPVGTVVRWLIAAEQSELQEAA